MVKRLRYELLIILIVLVVAFLQVFQPIRLVRASDQLANVYATYTVEKPWGHTRRARERVRREVVSKLMEEELFGIEVSFPTDRELRVRLEVTSTDSQQDVDTATRAIKDLLSDRFGSVSDPVVDASGLPDRPIFQLGPIGLYPLHFHVRRGLDLQRRRWSGRRRYYSRICRHGPGWRQRERGGDPVREPHLSPAAELRHRPDRQLDRQRLDLRLR